MTPYKKLAGHSTIMYCTFQSFVFEIDGHWYVQEDYQDGEIWSDDEIWGSVLYDLENKRKLDAGIYMSEEKWKRAIKEWEWDEMYEFDKDEYDTYKDAIEYYQKEIEKAKDEKRNRGDKGKV